MGIREKFINYILTVRRYSGRTAAIYADVLERFTRYSANSESDEDILSAMNPDGVRNYEVHIMDDEDLGARTANLHLSVLSAFGKWLAKEGLLAANPVSVVRRPKTPSALPVVFQRDAMAKYFEDTLCYGSRDGVDLVIGDDPTSKGLWKKRRNRLLVRMLYDTAVRRAELIGINLGSIDFGRHVLRVLGKGNKMREIPLTSGLEEEILLYLQVTASVFGCTKLPLEPLLVTENGKRLYPMAVQRIVEEELSKAGISGRKSPHVLRHTLATGLLDGGSDLNSIKELLGHSSLAATQVYTHTSIEKLKETYINAHPRAKRGG